MYYENLTINSGIVLNTNGYKIFVRNVLKNNGTIRNNGSDGNGINGGNGALKGSLEGGSNGGKGGISGYVEGDNGLNSFNSLGGAGGKGGGGQGTFGGQGGTVQQPASNFGAADEFIGALVGKATGRLSEKGTFRANRTVNQGISNNLLSQLNLDNTQEDYGGIINKPTYMYEWTFQKKGLYLVVFHCVFDINATGIRRTEYTVNDTSIKGAGKVITPVSGYPTVIDDAFTYRFNQGDKLLFKVYQNSGVTLNILGNQTDYRDTWASVTLLEDDLLSFMGGAGGGGGGGYTGKTAGGGGGGGGVILIAANIIDNSNGKIEAKGGKGADGSDNQVGGGGGGGGGVIILVYSNLIDGNIDVSGGLHGVGHFAGTEATDGQSGQIIKIKAL